MTYVKKPTPADIRAAVSIGDASHFFDRATMKFFGDTMRSFGTIQSWSKSDGGTADKPVTFLYRKPSASVNVFGTIKKAGQEHFNIWKFEPATGDLRNVSSEDTATWFNVLSNA